MSHSKSRSLQFCPLSSNFRIYLFQPIAILSIILVTALTGHADTFSRSFGKGILLEGITSANGSYGYRLEYYVPAPIDTFWKFKTDFQSDVLLTSKDVIDHQLVGHSNNSVVTENRYATAPELKFRWQTTVFARDYRLEFSLLNPKDCRHDFHFGTIQLIPAGNLTKVIQTAEFNFAGVVLWMKYPWYGGMKSTLTKLVKWEKKLPLSTNDNFWPR